MPYLRAFPALLLTSKTSLIALVFASLLATIFSLTPNTAYARGNVVPAIGEIKSSALPKEAVTTLSKIKSNGPYDYAKDGVVFSNRERILPQQKRGYYREFTVKTPGARNRGARRIVAGKVGEYYYTEDHYASFKRIKE